MCEVTISSVNGTPAASGATTTIEVKGTSKNCDFVKVTIQLGGAVFDSPVLPTAGGWSYQLVQDGNLCDQDVYVKACCVDENGAVNPDCCDEYSGLLSCESGECCLDFNVAHQIGECDEQGKREVTFNISFTVINQDCLPYAIYLHFGDGSGNSAPFPVNSLGNHTFTVSHFYPGGANYTAVLHYTFHTACGSLNIPISVPECDPKDCCPKISQVKIHVGDCDDQCRREVQLQTFFEPPAAGCGPGFLEWEFYDSNQAQVSTGSGFVTNQSSPHMDTLHLDSSQSPITAVLNVLHPQDCPDIEERTIVIPPCKGCPDIQQFTHEVKNCVKKGSECCRKVAFTVKGNFCGEPIIKIDYGDGNTDQRTITAKGNQTIVFENEYCSSGNYPVKLEVLSPANCPSKTINISVPKCDPEECFEVSPPTPTPHCPCCILLCVLTLLYFTLWAFGLYSGSVTVLGVTIGFGVSSFLFSLFFWLIITFCYKLNPDCRKCWECRVYKCMFWASIISAVVVLILFIIPAITVPLWLSALIGALGSALLFWTLMSSDRCQVFYDTGECK